MAPSIIIGIKSTRLPSQQATQLIEDHLFGTESICEKTLTELAEICQISILELRNLITAGKTTLPEAVTRFHAQKRNLKNKHFALTDVFYHQPLARAIEFHNLPVDVMLEKPLIGCIMSVKDSVIYKGSYSTHGFAKGFKEHFKESAGLITYLEERGALVTCKGNVPQALMACESDNNVFGNVSNPFDETRTAGGSSGGEAALVATYQVNCAIGSDIAGSLRIPALFCGIFSLKPTAGRFAEVESNLAHQWQTFSKTGDVQSLILPTCGPMARTAADIELLAKVMNTYNEVDMTLPPLPWRQVDLPQRIGLIRGFHNLLEPCSAADRALQQVASSFDIVDIDLGDLIEDLVVNSMACFFKDDQLMRLVRGQLKLGESLIDAFQEFKRMVSLPTFLLRILQHKLAKREQIYVRAYLLSRDSNNAALELQQSQLRQEVVRRFKEAGIESALCHGLFPSVRKYSTKKCDFLCFFCFVWNYLNFPVGAVPVTRVRQEEQTYHSENPDKVTDAISVNMEGSVGLPVGVQVVGLPWKDEVVVQVMKKLESVVDNVSCMLN